jgi:Winged helix DNA-binding domain
MANHEIAHLRLYQQHLSRATFKQPADVVAWFGAVQAQDYLGSLWAIGLRMQQAVEADIERALANRTIVRTWPMRGTLHFVAAPDVRWMLKLLTPRIVTGSARRIYQQAGLDEAIFTRSKKLFAGALQGGRQLPRIAMYEVLEKAGISTAEYRGLHIVGRLSQDGFLCFGARAGKQHTFALLDEWVPPTKPLEPDEALAEIARRYFTSHGPATLQDFAWWTGLKIDDARAGLEMAKPNLAQEVFDGRAYWLSPSRFPAKKAASPVAYLLPPYDEYTVAYQDRSAVLDPSYAQEANYGHGITYPIIVIDGKVVGTWKRTIKKNKLTVTPSPFAPLNKAETQAFAAAATRYGKFLGASVELS